MTPRPDKDHQGARKRKVPPTKRTCLVFGEGRGEEKFLKHLRNLYGPNWESNYSITISYGFGGSPCDIIKSALDRCIGKQFDKLAVVLDSDAFADKNFADEKLAAINKLRKAHIAHYSIPHEIVPHLNSPCLEAVLLRIHAVGPRYDTCPPYKGIFKSKFGKYLDEFTDKDWGMHFSMTILNSMSPAIPELQELIRLMSGHW
jgi:hypothetical protein